MEQEDSNEWQVGKNLEACSHGLSWGAVPKFALKNKGKSPESSAKIGFSLTEVWTGTSGFNYSRLKIRPTPYNIQSILLGCCAGVYDTLKN